MRKEEEDLLPHQTTDARAGVPPHQYEDMVSSVVVVS